MTVSPVIADATPGPRVVGVAAPPAPPPVCPAAPFQIAPEPAVALAPKTFPLTVALLLAPGSPEMYAS